MVELVAEVDGGSRQWRLFHKAILQSGVAFNPWASSVESPMESVNKLAAALGKNISDVKEFVEYLRTLDAHTLVETEVKMHSSKDEIIFNHPFLPSIDSSAENPFLIKSIDEVAKVGIKVPCMCGYVSHEGIIIAAAMNNEIFNKIDKDPENLLMNPRTSQFLKQHNVTVNDVKQFYFGDKSISSDNIENIIDLYTDAYFIFGLHHFVDIQSRVSKTPTYLYKFEYEAEKSYLKNFFGMENIKGQLANTNNVKLIWVPSHCGIPCNERADRLAKRGAYDAGALPVCPTPVSDGFINGLIAEESHSRFSDMWLEAKGTCHAEELNYIFYPMITKLLGKPPAAFNSIEYCLIQRFTELWTNFAKTGNPTPVATNLIDVQWKPIDNPTDYKCLEITDKLKMSTVKNVTRKLMENKK
ncbi:hypothetical protein PV327_008915 [Microctonus hyperodae]|uniref:Carboxylesterase type B domain-containing protein n=1 Tax=Microctonus hyperodae TaxID=165561 RepID=A0AA39FT41_MICHY|nr:hypothetical protein PV327_008915 [Microctonus hyperodae]